jgi:anti-sigma B factor antagonist
MIVMIDTEIIADGLRVNLTGEVNIYKVSDLKTSLLAVLVQAAEVELDLAEVSEIDSAGVQLLIALKKEAVSRGCALRLTNHSAAVFQLFELYNLAVYFGDPLFISTPEQQDFSSARSAP